MFQRDTRQAEAELFPEKKGNVNLGQEVKKKFLVDYFVTYRNFFFFSFVKQKQALYLYTMGMKLGEE